MSDCGHETYGLRKCNKLLFAVILHGQMRLRKVSKMSEKSYGLAVFEDVANAYVNAYCIGNCTSADVSKQVIPCSHIIPIQRSVTCISQATTSLAAISNKSGISSGLALKNQIAPRRV